MAITYPTRGAQVDYAPFPATETEPAGKGWLRRFLAALMESRMRQAEREIARYRHLVPAELEMSGNRLTARNEDELPFGR
jgi:hypothetical protein